MSVKSMKTTIHRSGNAVVVSIGGYLSFESNESFREELGLLERQAGQSRIVFDLSELQFVGSSGISSFIQTLRDFNGRMAMKPRYANVKSEFKKIFMAFDENESFEFWDTMERALKSFDN